jgi:hypothetical protein
MQRAELVRGLLLLDQVEQLCEACLIGKQRLGEMLQKWAISFIVVATRRSCCLNFCSMRLAPLLLFKTMAACKTFGGQNNLEQ